MKRLSDAIAEENAKLTEEGLKKKERAAVESAADK
jgi:hypothetical protein